MVRSLLQLQDGDAESVEEALEFAAALVAGWERQLVMEQSLGTSEDHLLQRIGTEPSQCGIMFWFEAEKANCSGDCGLVDPAALRHQLVFAGYPDNPFLNFQSALDFEGEPKAVVAIDPMYGLHQDGTSCVGTCDARCSMISSTPPGDCGWCCSCNGVTTTWKRAIWNPQHYICIP